MHGLPPLLGVRIPRYRCDANASPRGFLVDCSNPSKHTDCEHDRNRQSPPKVGSDESEPGEMDVRGAEQRYEQPVAGRCWDAENTTRSSDGETICQIVIE